MSARELEELLEELDTAKQTNIGCLFHAQDHPRIVGVPARVSGSMRPGVVHGWGGPRRAMRARCTHGRLDLRH